MPSPNTLRDMEDRWLDNSNADDSGALGSGVGRLGGSSEEDVKAGALDDMV